MNGFINVHKLVITQTTIHRTVEKVEPILINIRNINYVEQYNYVVDDSMCKDKIRAINPEGNFSSIEGDNFSFVVVESCDTIAKMF